MTPSIFAFAAGACLAVDGDGIKCNGERIRLLYIDAPERGEAGFQEAKDHMRVLIEGQRVTCYVRARRDRYGRLLADCGTEDTPSLSEAMLRAGLAQVYR